MNYSENHSEKRRLTRYEFGRDITVLKTENDKFFGHLENLSLEGMMLSSESPREVGEEHQVTFSVRSGSGTKYTISCRICSMWSGKNLWRDPSPSRKYCTGFQITDISDTELKTLKVLIKTFGYPAC